MEEGEGNVLDRGGHGVAGIDGAEDDRPRIAPLPVGHAGGFEVRNNGEILPHLTGEPRLRELLTQNGIRLAHGLQAVTGDGTDTADTEAGAGERLAVDHGIGQTERLADHAHLVLEQKAQRLDKLKLQVLRQTADIVVALDGAALQNVGVDRPLRQKTDAVQLLRLLRKHVDELRADDLALALRVGDTGELIQKAVNGIDIDKLRTELIFEDLDDLLRLTLAQQAVVDVDADELTTHRLDQQGGDDGGIHTAGQSQQHTPVADLTTQRLDLFTDKRLGLCRRFDTRHGFGTKICRHSFFLLLLINPPCGGKTRYKLELFLKTLVIYGALILLMRLIGKRQLGELELSELVVTILMSNIAAAPLTQRDSSLTEGLLPLVTLMLLEYLLSVLTMKNVKLRALLSGKPSLLVVRGRIDQKQMRKNRFTPDELTEALRNQGILDLRTIEYAILETDGVLNVIPSPPNRPVTAAQMGIQVEDNGYPVIVVNSGHILSDNLRLLGRDENWLNKVLREHGLRSSREVYLMTCDAGGGVFLAPRE